MKNFSRISMVVLMLALALQAPVAAAAQGVAQGNISQESVQKYGELSKVLKANQQKSVPELMIIVAKQMLGTEYVAGTLEKVPEQLVVSLTQTDCILFVESCLAMALNAKKGIFHPDSLCATIQSLRYRDGKVDGYASRIHYTSEWIRQGEARGIFREITDVLSGDNLSGQRFSYMSEHSDAYRQLKGNPAEVARIAQMEASLNQHTDYFVIPKEAVSKMEHLLKDGDILGFNSTVKGLDIAHVALVYHKENGQVGFIHASQADGKVVIDEKSIADYVNSRKSNNGIRIVRVNR
ncbi:MAG: DUF1460 domain-containing protein [Bacteroidales bacterium]|nr:DUF1460 domain-containing protein [Bacteroidales bacterium]